MKRVENTVHCCFDLELEQPKTNHQTPDSLLDVEKIIQVGYVIYKVEPEFKVLESVTSFVNINVPLSAFIKKLTGITDEQVASGGTINNAYNKMAELQKKYNFSRVLKQWGGGDDICMKAEVTNEPWVFGRSACNIKHIYQLYAESQGMNKSGGLAKSMKKCGLKWQGGGKHDAMFDALNTAVMHNFLYRRLKGE